MRRLSALTIGLALIAGAASAGGYRAPRDAYGRPSLEGIWTSNTATPLERPAAFSALATDEAHAKAFESGAETAFYNNGDPVGARTSEWWEKGWTMMRIGGGLRTSLLIEPTDGKLPYSPFGRERQTTLNAEVLTDYRAAEVRSAPERCLAGNSGSSGVPMLPANYNNNYAFLQTRDAVAISMEPMHEMRIIPLGAKRAAPSSPTRWAGNSVGWWEGQTLVVETAGFNPRESFKPSAGPYTSDKARVTERFTRIGHSQILYRFTVDDPVAYVRPWTGEMLLSATPGPLFEVACHEGNYALEGILAGARQAEERRTAAGEPQPSDRSTDRD